MRKKSLNRPQGCWGKIEIGRRRDSKNICTVPEIDSTVQTRYNVASEI